MGNGPRRRGAPWADALVIGACFLLLYILLGQWTWYKIDGQITVMRMAEGGPGHPRHLLADEALRAFLALIEPLGFSTYGAVRLFSAVGAAAAGVVLHRCAARIGLSRTRCALAQTALASTPSLMFYASIVEFHATLLFCASLAFYVTTWLGTQDPWQTKSWLPKLASAALAGALSGLATLQHASGQVLPALLLPWLFVLAWPAARTSRAVLLRLLACMASIAVVHAAVVKGVPYVIRRYDLLERFAPLASEDAGAMSYVTWHLESLSFADLRFVPTTLFFEWVLPFVPVSLLCLFAARRVHRGALIALGVGLVPPLAISFLLMRHENEFGAYTIPCALLASLLAARCAPPRLLVGSTLLALFAAVVHVRLHDQDLTGRRLAEALRRAGSIEQVLLLVANEAERDAALMALPHRAFPQYLWIEAYAAHATREVFERWLQEQEKLGRRVLATSACLSWLGTAQLTKDAYRSSDAQIDALPGAAWIHVR